MTSWCLLALRSAYLLSVQTPRPAKAKTFEKWKPPGRVKHGQNLLSITPLIMFLIDFLFLPTIYYQTTNMAIKSSHSLKWHVHKSCFFLQSKWTDILFTVLQNRKWKEPIVFALFEWVWLCCFVCAPWSFGYIPWIWKKDRKRINLADWLVKTTSVWQLY